MPGPNNPVYIIGASGGQSGGNPSRPKKRSIARRQHSVHSVPIWNSVGCNVL